MNGLTRKGSGWWRALATVVLLLLMGGCAMVDDFDRRAVNYNVEGEEARNQNLVINIVRAAQRKPLQFTDLTTVTGQASVSVDGELEIPFATSGGSLARAYTFTPNVSVSGGPNFTVAMLNTKEFYAGVLRPIDVDIINYYLHKGIPKSVFLTLLVQRIDFPIASPVCADATLGADRSGGSHCSFYNELRGDGYRSFQAVLNQLIANRLTAERYTKKTLMGPPVDRRSLDSAWAVANLFKENIRAVPCDVRCTPEQRVEGRYILQREQQASRFCFEPATSLPSGTLRIDPNDELSCGVFGRGGPSTLNPDKELFKLHTRSVVDIIYFLGEIARMEWAEGREAWPSVLTNNGEDTLFRLHRGSGPSGSAAIRASYDGAGYAVAVDPSGRDRSTQVLAILLELLALNTSSKDLPAPNVISVVAP